MRKSKRVLSIFTAICLFATTLISGQGLVFAAATSVWTESSYLNIFKDTPKPGDATTSINLTVAKNEYEAAQILIRRDAAFTINSVSFTNLTSESNTISASNLKYQFVEYKNQIGNTGGISLLIRKGSGDYPDPLSNATSMAVAANTTQSIWVRSYIPTATVAGVYNGTVTVNTTAGNFNVSISLDVKNVTIPDPSNGTFSNAMWAQFFGPISWDLVDGESFMYAFPYARRSSDWWTVVDNMADLMKQNRSNVLPLNMDYLLMDGGTYLDTNGVYHFNWSAFDEVIQFFINKGVVKELQGMFMAQGNGTNRAMVQLIDRDSNGDPCRGYYAIENSKAQAWIDQFIPSIKSHLISKGWIDKFWLSIQDEPNCPTNLADYQTITNRVKTAWNGSPGTDILKIGDAVYDPNYYSYLVGYMNRWIPNHATYDPNIDWFNVRKAQGDEVWLYNCSEPRGSYLNRYIDQPVWEQRSTMWYCYKKGLTGYLHYGYNVWRSLMNGEDFYLEGDGWITYPDSANKKFKSSIRYESLRDGIEDYELLKILEQTQPDVAKNLVDNLVNTGVNYSLDTKLMERTRANLVRAAAGLPMFSTNLAYNKTVTASSQASGYEASRAIDNNLSTEWRTTAAGNQWIQIDLGAAQYQVDGIKLKWGSTNYATSYTVKTSNNNVYWQDVYSTTTGNGGEDYIPLSGMGVDPVTVKARYIHIFFNGCSGSSYNLYNLEFGGQQLPKVNLAAGKTYTNSNSGTSPYLDAGNSEATDGIISGEYLDTWSFGQRLDGGIHSPYQVIDLGSAQTVNQVKVHTYGAVEDNYTTEWVKVFTSTDNVNFTQKAWLMELNDKNEGRWYDITFPDTSARYIKVQYFKTYTPGQDLNWLFQDEIEVYGGVTGTNQAAGRSYMKNTAPDVSWPDTNNLESTDGKIGGEWTDAMSYGYSIPEGTTTTVKVTVDLGSDKSISLAKLRKYEWNLGKYAPDNVKVLTATSAAPTTFTSRGEVSTPKGLWFEIPFSSVTARYVCFEVSKYNYGGATNTSCMFLDELTVY